MTHDETLNLLAIFHYVWGGLILACSCFPVIHIVFGAAMLGEGGGRGEAQVVGGVFMLVGLLVMALFWVMGGCVIGAGRFLKQRQHWTFCVVIAALTCLSFPIGTALGVFTLITLFKPEVKAEFGVQA